MNLLTLLSPDVLNLIFACAGAFLGWYMKKRQLPEYQDLLNEVNQKKKQAAAREQVMEIFRELLDEEVKNKS